MSTLQSTYSSYLDLCRNVAAVVGMAWLSAKLLKGAGQLISCLRAYFLSPWLGLGKLNLAKYGAWAGMLSGVQD